MKKKEEEKKDINEVKDEDLITKVLNLCIFHQIEDSNGWIRILESQLEIFKEYRKQLLEQLDDCIFKSQKNKVRMEIEEIDEKISNQYTKIKEEVSMLNKLKTAIINGENKVELVSDDIFSYYDLLTFLKNGIIFKKVNVHNFEKDVTYIYDNEGNYVLENKDDESLQFAMYLSENSNDNTKFERNITVIEE